MAVNSPANARATQYKRNLGVFALSLGVILATLFFRSFDQNEVAFSNDAPLGGLSAALNRAPAVFLGAWHDLNWIGSQSPTPPPSLTGALRWLAGPLGFSKWFYPYALLTLGLCAWVCFRQWEFSPLACLLGGLAAALSSHFLSTACWGVASQTIALGLNFAALGFLFDDSSRNRWLKTILAGLAVGMNIMEAYDIGAIFSLYVAAFMVFQSFASD